MVYIGSIGLGIPEYEMTQNEVKQLVHQIFKTSKRKLEKLSTIFENTLIEKRQFVVDQEWFKTNHSFAKKNELYIANAKKLSIQAIDTCLNNADLLKEPIPYEAIDLIV